MLNIKKDKVGYLANILVKSKFEDIAFYNVVSEESSLIEGIPTLIVGWELAKSLYPEASILDWQINDNTYWTYEKRIRRQNYESDIAKFKKEVLNKIIKTVGYKFISVLTCDIEEKIWFNNLLNSDEPKTVFIDGDLVYVCVKSSKMVYGVSLLDIDYSNGNRKRILYIIFNTPSIKIVKERDILSYDTREILKNHRFLIPYIGDLVLK